MLRWVYLWTSVVGNACGRKVQTTLVRAAAMLNAPFIRSTHRPYVALNPDPLNLPKLDPKDAFLIGDSVVSTITSASPSTPVQPAWLRRTEYISREMRSAPSSQEQYVEAYSNVEDR
jgi:hypothetical protein